MASNTEQETIEPAVVIPTKRRKVETNWSKCVFCQGAEALSCASQQGIKRLFASFADRANHETTEILTRLEPDITTPEHLTEKQPKWHKSCYATFTNQTNIDFVKKRHTENTAALAVTEASTSTRPLTRTIIPKVDWKQCIYCQIRKREKVHQVQSDEVEARIRHHSQYDYTLKCKIGENDLISYEAHYHSSCKHKADKLNRSVHPDETKAIGSDPSLDHLIQILDNGFERGHISAGTIL